jgi:Carboxypeptidase regulatory-like domain
MPIVRQSSFLVLLCALLIFATGILLTPRAVGQSTGTIEGTVTDPSNAAVTGATVTVRSQTTGVECSTRTDAAGAYLMTGLLPDVYRVQVSAQGFETSVINNLKLDVATTSPKTLDCNSVLSRRALRLRAANRWSTQAPYLWGRLSIRKPCRTSLSTVGTSLTWFISCPEP